MNWHPNHQPRKLSAYRTSEWTSAPAVKMGLALAGVAFVDTYMWELGQARVRAFPLVPTGGPDLWLLQS